MKHFALVYDVVENVVERRTPFRATHLQRLRDAEDIERAVVHAEAAALFSDYGRTVRHYEIVTEVQ